MIENINEDVVFLFTDERISIENIKKIISSKRKLSLLYHDKYYYYLGIFKLRKDVLNIINDNKYLNYNFLK